MGRPFHIIKLEGRRGRATLAAAAYTNHSPFLSSVSTNVAYSGHIPALSEVKGRIKLKTIKNPQVSVFILRIIGVRNNESQN